jgi:hypothetical protein
LLSRDNHWFLLFPPPIETTTPPAAPSGIETGIIIEGLTFIILIDGWVLLNLDFLDAIAQLSVA